MAVVVLQHQKSLIHGLPNDLVMEEILSRAASKSWWDGRSIRAVSRGWRNAVEHSDSPVNMLGAIHRVTSSASSLTLAISVFDPNLRSWEQLPPLPGVPCGAFLSARCICVDGKLFVLGGRMFPGLEFVDRVFSINLRAPKRVWIECSRMKVARCGFACMEWNGKIVVAGGQTEDAIADTSVEIYDPTTDSWNEMPEMGIPRAECTGAVFDDGTLCVIGGYTIHPADDEQTVWVNVSEVWDDISGEWKMSFEESTSGRAVVSSGSLSRASGSLFGASLDRTWGTVKGRICAADDGEGDSRAVLVMAVAHGSEEYVTKSEIDPRSGRALTSVWRKNHDSRDSWEEIQLPFELVPTVSCCSIQI